MHEKSKQLNECSDYESTGFNESKCRAVAKDERRAFISKRIQPIFRLNSTILLIRWKEHVQLFVTKDGRRIVVTVVVRGCLWLTWQCRHKKKKRRQTFLSFLLSSSLTSVCVDDVFMSHVHLHVITSCLEIHALFFERGYKIEGLK